VTDFDLAQTDRLLTTTKQVRKRLDLGRPVPREVILECIDIASHAPMGGNRERNRWLVIDDPEVKAAIAPYYERVGRPYLDAGAAVAGDDARQAKVVDSARFLLDKIAEVPSLVLAMRLDRVANDSVAEAAGFYGSVVPGVWSLQMALRSRGIGSAWTTFHLVHEREVGEILGIPESVTQVALLPVAYYTGDSFSPAPRRPATEITYFNSWKGKAD